jgi:nitronate monooxygenase
MLVTDLTRRLQIDHPIVQAGMGSGAGWRLVSAVSNAGALGTLGTITRTPSATIEEIEAIRTATAKPFAVNVICFDWAPFAAELFDAVIDAHPPAITLSFGDPPSALARCKSAGIFTMVQVQDLGGLAAAIDGGADAVIVQGNEAGGHTGRRGTLNFVAQALELTHDVPVVAAGGVAGGRGLAAALAMGCAGALLGTRFKATDEYVAEDRQKDEVVASDGSDTVYDEVNDLAYGGLWPNKVTGRALRNAFTDEWAGRHDELREKVAGYPPFGFVQELAEQGTIINWAGEASGLVDRVRPAAEIVQQTAAEAEDLLRQAASLAKPQVAG